MIQDIQQRIVCDIFRSGQDIIVLKNLCELTRKFTWMVGRLRPDHLDEFVGVKDLFEPRSGANNPL